jgi:cell division protein FtsB
LKIYELARDLSVDKEALLSFAQSKGIEAKSIASELTPEQVDNLLIAFDEAGGVLESVEAVSKITAPQVTENEVSKKQGFFKSGLSNLKKYEKQPKEPKIPKTKTVKEGTALRIYRLVALLVIALFIGLGYSAYNANIQVTELTKKVNETTQTLSENQKVLMDQSEKLTGRVKTLEDGQKKSESSSKSTDKKASAPKAKVQPSKNKK